MKLHPPVKMLVISLSLLALLIVVSSTAGAIPYLAVDGPGLGNLTYNSNELFEVVSRINQTNGVPATFPGSKAFGLNAATMHNGYFMTLFAPDSGGGPGGFLFYDVSNPRDIELVKVVYEPTGRTADFRESHAFGLSYFNGNQYVVIQTGRGIEFWDVQDVMNPVQVSKLALPNVNFGDYANVSWQLFWQAPYVYVAAANQGIFIVNASNPASPFLVDRGGGRPNPVPTSELGGFRIGPIFAMGNLLMVSSMESSQGFSILDISDPLNPFIRSTLANAPTFYYATCFNGDKVAVSVRGAGAAMLQYNVSNPDQIVLENDDLVITDQLYCASQDNFVIQGAQEEIVKVNVSNPNNYTIVGRGSLDVSTPDHGQVTMMGNIVFVGNDHGTGSGFIVHQTQPDTTAPSIRTVNPALNATVQSTCSRVGLSFSDNIELSTVDSSTFIVRPIGGQPLSGLYSGQLGIVNFSPSQPLAPNTTYQVQVPAGGVKDWAGNAIATTFNSQFTTGTTCGVPAPPLEGQWPLDSNANDIIGGNNGTVSGAVFTQGGLQFDGVDDVVTLQRSLNALGQTSSLSVKVKTTQVGNNTNWQAPGITGVEVASGDNDIFWGWLDATGRLSFNVGNDTPIKSTAAINNNQWHHVVMTRNQATGAIQMYVDGVLNASGTNPTGLKTPPASFGRIEDTGGTPVYFAGILDDVRVFDHVLTAQEVQDLSGGISVNATSPGPRQVNTSVNFQAFGSGTGTIEYSWNFGDGSAATPFSTTSTASRTYANAGHYQVVVTVRNGSNQASATFIQTVHHPATANRPTRSSTIAITGTMIYATNQDNDTLTAISDTNLTKQWEVNTGKHPRTVAIAPDGSVWVVNRDDATITRHNASTGALLGTITLPYGSKPFGLAFSPNNTNAYVTLEASGQLLKLNTSGGVVSTLNVGPWPRGVAISSDSSRVLITRFISPDAGAQVVEVNGPNMTVTRTFNMAPDTTTVDGEDRARGLFNYLNTVTISPDGRHAWITAKKDNIFRGNFRDTRDLNFENTIRAATTELNLINNTENTARRIDYNDRSMPTAVSFTPLGDYAFVVMEGSNTVEIRDVYNGQPTGGVVNVGSAPRGVILNNDGSRLYIHNFISRNVAVYNVTGVRDAVNFAPVPVATVSTVANEKLAANVLLGKRIFYNASDARMNRDNYFSCGTCHSDGGQDGRVWDFTEDGEGLRNTVSLEGRAGIAHGRVHWTGNFDEIQDFENDIRSRFDGTGFMTNADFTATSNPLGTAKAGRSADLDALAAFVGSLNSFGKSPHRTITGTLTADAVIGKTYFQSVGCATCHAGNSFTDSPTAVRHNVGTVGTGSGLRIGQPIDGFDTPTLAGLWLTAPYLHNSAAATLADVLNNTTHVGTLNADQKSKLAAYLLQIDDSEVGQSSSGYRYVRLVANSEVLGNRWTSVAELNVLDGSGSAINRAAWSVTADSQETVDENNPATFAIDGNNTTFWHTEWAPGGAATDPPHPHQITINLGANYNISGFRYLPRQTGTNGRIANYQFYLSTDGVNWGTPVAQGTFPNSATEQTVNFGTPTYRYVRLVATSEVNANPWTSVAELNVLNGSGSVITRTGWTITADSQETAGENAPATNAIDGNTATFWHTQWQGSSPAHPHQITINMGANYTLGGFRYLPRQSGTNGRIANYQFFVSADGVNWGTAVAQGTFPNNATEQTVNFGLLRDGKEEPTIYLPIVIK